MTRSEIQTSIQEVIDPFKMQMQSQYIECNFINDIGKSGSEFEESYLANWDLVNQAVFHPIVNAVKFNKMRGSIDVTVKIKTDKRCDRDNMYLICEIYDTGMGIAADQLKHLFTAFRDETQIVMSDKKSGEVNAFTGATHGIGLGLSTTKILVNAQGGSIDV